MYKESGSEVKNECVPKKSCPIFITLYIKNGQDCRDIQHIPLDPEQWTHSSVEDSPREDNRGRIQLGLQVAEPSEQKLTFFPHIIQITEQAQFKTLSA